MGDDRNEAFAIGGRDQVWLGQEHGDVGFDSGVDGTFYDL